jgi:hypothetical protein
MWMTPIHILILVALLLAAAAAASARGVGLRIFGLQRSHTAVTDQLGRARHDFEKSHHLVVTPAAGTPVVLIEDSYYLREYHGAPPGQRGTVIEPSRLGSGDTGVLVDWGVRPNDMVRMDLNELKLAPHA